MNAIFETFSFADIANTVVALGSEITQVDAMTPQRINLVCYYANAYSLIETGKRLINESFEAGNSQTGPCNRAFYNAFKKRWKKPVQLNNIRVPAESRSEFVCTALRAVATVKTSQLLDLCLNSSAWCKARDRAGISIGRFDCSEPLIDAEIREHFLRERAETVVQKALNTTINANDGDSTVIVVFHAGGAYPYHIGKGERLTVSGNEPDDPEFIDRVGGSHSGGVGNAPDGTFCGECTYGSCENCPVWERIRASKSGKV